MASKTKISDVRITFRLNNEEYKMLQDLALDKGVTVSTLIRSLVTAGKKLDANSSKAQKFSMREEIVSLRKEFKKLSQQNLRFIDLFKEHGANTEITNSIIQTLLDIQSCLNEIAELNKMYSIHFVAKKANMNISEEMNDIDVSVLESTDEKGIDAEIQIRIKFYYMEKILIRGYIQSDAKTAIGTVSNQKLIRFPVVCTSNYSKETPVIYEVICLYSQASNIFEYLLKDKIVTVSGSYDCYVEKKLRNYIFSDSIKLGGTQTTESMSDSIEVITVVGNLAADASKFTSKKGEEKMKFRVICNKKRKGKTVSVGYDVIMPYSDAFNYLKKGKQVTVIGDYSLKTDGSQLNVENCIYGWSLALGGEI